MCLTKEWFMQSKERESMRNEKGVKLEHAIEDLRMIHSSLFPSMPVDLLSKSSRIKF
jgi:hypothetical protein